MNLLWRPLSIIGPAGQPTFAFNTDLAILPSLPTFVRVLLGHALRHLRDDLAHLPRVLLDAHLLLRVEVGLHRVTQHDLRQHRHRAGRGVRPSF